MNPINKQFISKLLLYIVLFIVFFLAGYVGGYIDGIAFNYGPYFKASYLCYANNHSVMITPEFYNKTEERYIISCIDPKTLTENYYCNGTMGYLNK